MRKFGLGTLGLALLVGAVAGAAETGKARTLLLTTGSAEAKARVIEAMTKVENFEPAARVKELAKQALGADPDFAFAHYLVGTTTQPTAEGKPFIEKALALAKNASPGEQRYLEAAMLNRSSKPREALAILTQLRADFPDDRMVTMLLGQIQLGQGQLDEAKAAFEQAIAFDATTARAYALLGNVHLLLGNYGQARELFEAAKARKAADAAPGSIFYGIAFSHLYEGHPDPALESLQTFLGEYRRTGGFPGLPEVFIWNSMARINLENGRMDEAMKKYESGFESVPGSGLSEADKQIWLGRLHHGRGRTLARMGRHQKAWREAEVIQKMIDEGGDAGKRFVPAYHYLVGYLKLEAGDFKAAIEHLTQSNELDPDPFRELLLARAYEKAGDKAAARKTYQQIVDSKQNNIERALAFPEAKRKLG